MAGKLKQKREKYAKIKREALKLFVEGGVSLKDVAERLGVNYTTVKNWSRQGRWVDLRSEAGIAKDTKAVRAIRHELREKLPEALMRNIGITESLLKRSAAVIMNRGRFCEHCGRGPDTDKGIFRPSAGDVASLIKLEMHLLGGDDQSAMPELESTELPELPEEFVIQAAVLFARFEGVMPAVALMDDGSILAGNSNPAEEPDD